MKQWWKLLIISAQTTLGSVIPGPVLTLLVIVKKNKKIPYFQSRVTPISRQNTAAAKSLQSCPTLCDSIDGNPPGSPIPGILQARTLEWVAISFSNAGKWKVKGKSLSRVRLFATPWTAVHQAPLSMDFPGKTAGVGCHCLLQEVFIVCLNIWCASKLEISELFER